jgi:hypothetical protein
MMPAVNVGLNHSPQEAPVMSRSLRIGLPVLFLLGAMTAAHGNEAAPPRLPARERPEVLPRGARRATLTVEVDDRVKEARLQIPANLLPPAAPAAPARGADAGPWHLPTVVAGVALTLAFATGGLWLLRRGTTRRVAAGGLLLALFALGGTALFADIPGPGRGRPRPPAPPGPLPTLLLPADVRLSPNIVVEVVEKGDGVKLIVNKAMLGKPGGSAEAPAPAPKRAD